MATTKKKTTTKAASGRTSTKKTVKKAPAKKSTRKAAPKAPREKAPVVEQKARHPFARVKELHGTKEALVKTLVDPLAAEDEDTDLVKARLLKASNQQLLRLATVVATVKDKYGSREKLIASIGKAENKTKDEDYLAKLGTMPLPRLLDMARASERRAKQAE